MSPWQFILRSLAYHWRVHLAVALSVAAATSVLTGALLVGDSMRGSLAHLALDRLGQIDDVLVADRFFRQQLATELAGEPEFRTHFDRALPAILMPGSMKGQRAEHRGRSAQVTIVGCDTFGTLGHGGPRTRIEPGQVVINEPLARDLGVRVGDEVLLRIGEVSLIPPDSPLGRKTETVRTRRLQVSEVIPAQGLGRFGLRPTQQLPHNAYVTIETLTSMLDLPGKANAIFVAGTPADSVSDRALDRELKPRLSDYGFSFDETPGGCWQFVSRRFVIDPVAETAVLRDLAAYHPQPVLTYLANTLRVGSQAIPYSTISGIDFTTPPPLGPFEDVAGKALAPLADDEIALNDWAANDLGAKIGDQVELTYFDPETLDGEVRERSVTLRLSAIAALKGAAADRHLTPEMPGVTDQASIGDWNPPFPFDAHRVRKKDEAYWNEYRATPKAFVSLSTVRKLWASRFGQATSIRLAVSENISADELTAQLKLDPKDFGFRFLPVRRQALQAAAGTTPFDGLFLAFSFFIIASAIGLVALLFQLGIEQRAGEIGLLLALGMARARILAILFAEGLTVAAIGALAGLAGGVGYAWLMLAGLRTWWLRAISTPFLDLYVTPRSLALGYFISVGVAAVAIYWTVRRMGSISVRQLLSGQAAVSPALARRTFRWPRRIGWALLVVALLIGSSAMRLSGETQAGAFFSSGTLVLIGLLILVFTWLRTDSPGHAGGSGSGLPVLGYLAKRSASRNPGRSTLSIGLVAAASFLIVATGAFRIDPEDESRGQSGGSGGIALVCESAQPIYQDLNSPAGRSDLGFTAPANRLLEDATTIGLRVQSGDDASCLNLYRPSQPRVLGVPKSLLQRGGFGWAASSAQTLPERENPWLLLDRELPPDDVGVQPVPVVLDLNTAMYSLHLLQGVGETYDITDERGNRVRLKIVGLLKNSLFQGDLLVSEQHFKAFFPGVNGYRMFLIAAPAQRVASIEEALDDTLEDYGFSAQTTMERLAALMAVQNTYLSTFQSLGALGLLLGTFGLATVQLRNVVERRGELALMQAVGFRRRRLAELVLLEHALLLTAGLGVGVLAALVAVLPHLIGSSATIPWAATSYTLAIVLCVGLLAGVTSVRAALHAQLLPAIRAE